MVKNIYNRDTYIAYVNSLDKKLTHDDYIEAWRFRICKNEYEDFNSYMIMEYFNGYCVPTKMYQIEEEDYNALNKIDKDNLPFNEKSLMIYNYIFDLLESKFM